MIEEKVFEIAESMIEKLSNKIQQLEKELKEANDANTRLRESNFYLQKESTTLKQQLSEIKGFYSGENMDRIIAKPQSAEEIKYLTDKDVEKVRDMVWELCKKNNISSDVRNKIVKAVENLCKLAVTTWLQLAEQKHFTDTNARIALRFKEDIANQPKLTRNKVEDIVNVNIEYDEDGNVTEAYAEDIVTAICNLAVK